MRKSRSKIFQVAAADFCAIWRIEDPSDWEPPFVVREGGIFIPPPSQHLLRVLTPAELGAVSHPTGTPDEPVLPFPCSLEEMISWARATVGEVSNLALVSWMRGRVTQHSDPMCESPPLPFQINEEDAHRLLPDAEPSRPFPNFPCPIEALFEWCDSEEKQHVVAQPSNERVVRLMRKRMTSLPPPEETGTRKLGGRERNSLMRIVLGLGGRDAQFHQPEWESLSREEFYLLIAAACKKGNFSMGRGSIAGIEKQLEEAAIAGWIFAPWPKKQTLRDILDAVRDLVGRSKG